MPFTRKITFFLPVAAISRLQKKKLFLSRRRDKSVGLKVLNISREYYFLGKIGLGSQKQNLPIAWRIYIFVFQLYY